MPNNPKLANREEYDRVASLVEPGRYKAFRDAEDSPFMLARGIEDKLLECVVVGSLYEPEQPVELPDRSLTPSGTLLLVRVFRKCDHDGSPHINKDDHLFYTNSAGYCLKYTPSAPEEHYYPIVEASPLKTLIEEVPARPNNAEGTLEDYVSNCASLDFKKLCPGIREEG